MDKFDRIFQLHSILASRRTPIPLEQLEAKLECSKSTVLRAINTMKDYLGAPIEFDRDAGGYKYGTAVGGEAYELPGLWFTASELQSLAIMRRLLKDAGGGLLEEHLGPLAKWLEDLTRHQRLNLGEAASRLRFPAIAARPAGEAFKTSGVRSSLLITSALNRSAGPGSPQSGRCPMPWIPPPLLCPVPAPPSNRQGFWPESAAAPFPRSGSVDGQPADLRCSF